MAVKIEVPAKTYADVAKGIPVCRICQQNTKKKIVWQNDRFLIFTVPKSAWPGHCIIVSKQHIPFSQVSTTPALVDELYGKIVPMLCEKIQQLIPCTSFDYVARGHLPHMVLQLLPRREDGTAVGDYRDPQPQKALDMSINSTHSFNIDAQLTSLLNPPLIVVNEPLPLPSKNQEIKEGATVQGSSCCIM